MPSVGKHFTMEESAITAVSFARNNLEIRAYPSFE